MSKFNGLIPLFNTPGRRAGTALAATGLLLALVLAWPVSRNTPEKPDYPIRYRVERASESRADITCPILWTMVDTMTGKEYIMTSDFILEVKPYSETK